jgi:hypothetical protein
LPNTSVIFCFCTVRVFRQKFTLEDAIGSHACSLEANMRVNNGIPLGSSLLLPVHTVICVQTLKATNRRRHSTTQSIRSLNVRRQVRDRCCSSFTLHTPASLQVTSALMPLPSLPLPPFLPSSLHRRTSELLHEIILVDDGSNADYIVEGGSLASYVAKLPVPVHIVRCSSVSSQPFPLATRGCWLLAPRHIVRVRALLSVDLQLSHAIEFHAFNVLPCV